MYFQKQPIIKCFRTSILFRWKKLFLESQLLPAGKIAMKITMQKCVKISWVEFVLNVDPSLASGILIQNNLLHCYAICVISTSSAEQFSKNIASTA